HAGGAVAALHGPAVHECFLYRVELVAVRQALDGAEFLARDGADAGVARPHGLAIHEDGAAAATALAAAVLRPREAQIVAQDAEQRAVGVRGERSPGAVDVEFGDRRHGRPPGEIPPWER